MSNFFNFDIISFSFMHKVENQLTLDVDSAIEALDKVFKEPKTNPHPAVIPIETSKETEDKTSFVKTVLTPARLLRMHPQKGIEPESCFLGNTQGIIKIRVKGNFDEVWRNKTEPYLEATVIYAEKREDKRFIDQRIFITKGDAVRKPTGNK